MEQKGFAGVKIAAVFVLVAILVFVLYTWAIWPKSAATGYVGDNGKPFEDPYTWERNGEQGEWVKTFEVGEKVVLVAKGQKSDVSVRKGEVGAVVVRVRKHGTLMGPEVRETRVRYEQGKDERGVERITLGVEPFDKEVDYDITVPATAEVEIAVDAGSLLVSGVSGANVDTGSGSVRVEGVQGAVKAHTSSGDITVRDVKGPVKVEGESGSLRLSGIVGQLSAVTKSGDVVVRESQMSGVSVLKTSSGSVRYEGSLDRKGTYTLATNSGNVDLTLPATSVFQLNARTGSGNVNNEFGQNRVGEAPWAQVAVTIGSGSVSVVKAAAR